MNSFETPHFAAIIKLKPAFYKLDSPQEVIRQFTPSWFAVSMGTGAMMACVRNLPWPLPHADSIAFAVWILNIIMFTTFTLLFLCRFIFFFHDFTPLLSHPVQSMYFGCISMAMSTVINGIVFFGIPRGASAIDAAVILWIINVVVAVLPSFLLYYLMMTDHDHTLDKMTAVWLLPVVAPLVASATGGLIVPNLSQQQARSIIYVCYLLLGLAFPSSYSILVIFYQRLIIYKLPPSEMIVCLFLPLGPLGTTAQALQLLGTAWSDAFAGDQELAQYATTAKAGGVLVALLLIGYAFMHLVIAIMGFTRAGLLKQLRFNIGWWALTFPMGVFFNSVALMANITNSNGFRIVAEILGVTVMVLWVFVFCLTAQKTWSGELFYAPCLTVIKPNRQSVENTENHANGNFQMFENHTLPKEEDAVLPTSHCNEFQNSKDSE